MILYDSNVSGPNPVVVRLFVLERGGLDLEVLHVDLANLENRRKAFRETVNARGELPALRLDDGRVITEITAICGYLDEVAAGGVSLFGTTAEERAITQMWTRRVYLEICGPFVEWWRGSDAAEGFYRGNRILAPGARVTNRLTAEAGLNHLDDDLEGRDFICGNRIMMPDILLYAFMASMKVSVPWLNPPGRTNVARWYANMEGRETSVGMLSPLPSRVSS